MAAQTIAFNRQEELNRIIKSMAECAELDETQVWDTINKLSEIYAGDFRHSYSEFFPLLLGIAGDEGKYSLDFLMNNLLMLGNFGWVFKINLENRQSRNKLLSMRIVIPSKGACSTFYKEFH